MRNHILVIVTYNRRDLLLECMDSVFAQTHPYTQIVIVDNASTDGTQAFLLKWKKDSGIVTIREEQNIGGAGGFADGIRKALALDADWITIIDDDAILRPDFLEKIDQGIDHFGSKVSMFAGVPLTDGIRPGHRRRIKKRLLIWKEYPVPIEEYRKKYFSCQIASFCGLVVSGELVRKIGLPEKDYFIWYDDTEYCLRARKYSLIINCNQAVIDHKAVIGTGGYQVGWKEYYGVRNKIDMTRHHYGRWTTVYVVVRKILHGWKDSISISMKEGWREGINVQKIYADGIWDGLTGKLGKKAPYLPAESRRNG